MQVTAALQRWQNRQNTRHEGTMIPVKTAAQDAAGGLTGCLQVVFD